MQTETRFAYGDEGCPVCFGEHQEDIHEASLSVHAYLRERMERLLAPPPARDPRKPMPTISVSAFPVRLRRAEPLRVDRPAVEPGPVRVKAANAQSPKSPASRRRVFEVGETFNSLSFVADLPIKTNGRRHAMWQCVCGNLRKVKAWHVVSGVIKSCGCKNKFKKRFVSAEIPDAVPGSGEERCKRGHLWTEFNAHKRIVKGREVRECRMCRSILNREAYRLLKGTYQI